MQCLGVYLLHAISHVSVPLHSENQTIPITSSQTGQPPIVSWANMTPIPHAGSALHEVPTRQPTQGGLILSPAAEPFPQKLVLWK